MRNEMNLSTHVHARPLRRRAASHWTGRHWTARYWLGPATMWLIVALGTAVSSAQQDVLIVVGAAGAKEYKEVFAETAQKWQQVAKRAEARATTIGLEKAEDSDLAQLTAALKERSADGDALWIVLIGHGTFDGKLAKFNLRGADLTATYLAEQLERFQRPLVVINGASSSAPFINRISRPGRVIVTATDSGYELNYARFGIYLADAMLANEVDLDKDQQTSILEAFLAASQQTAAFYEADGRLVTEHALIDDNGDGRGTSRDFFRGVRVVTPPKEGQADGLRANQLPLIRSQQEQSLSPEQRRRRSELEQQIEELRRSKGQLEEDVYFQRLEELLLQLADTVL